MWPWPLRRRPQQRSIAPSRTAASQAPLRPDACSVYGSLTLQGRNSFVGCVQADTTDAFSGAKLASAGFVSEKLKTRRLELHGPDVSVGMEFTGRL